MPILDCRCRTCGKAFDYLSWGESDRPECPACASREVERLLTTFAVAGTGTVSEVGPACTGDPGSCGRCGSGAFPDA